MTGRLVLRLCVMCVVAAALARSDYELAAQILVTNEQQFSAALSTAQPGDNILVAPGVYNGGFFQAGLTGVTIRSQDPNDRAIIRGGTNGIQLSDASSVMIEDLIFEQQTGNGINIDDGGSFSTPTTDLTLRNLLIRDIATSGNRDGIKMSGVTGFHIDRVQVVDWGDSGSAIDFVGVHNGVVENSFVRQTRSGFSSAFQAKGGSKNIVYRANRVQLDHDLGRAMQFGGQTDAPFFRYIDGDSGYEARDNTYVGNVVVGGRSAFNFDASVGGLFHSNYVSRPNNWMVRILSSYAANPSFVPTQNGTVQSNVLVYNDTATEYSTDVNVGPGTEPQTFTFDGNTWLNLVNPSDSEPTLPVSETNGIYGAQPDFDENSGIGWEFEWGTWAVNATQTTNTIPIAPGYRMRAIPGGDAIFDPLALDPFTGSWDFQPFTALSITLEPFAQAYFTAPGTLPGDFNEDALWNCDDIDMLVAAIASGSTNVGLFDMNNDGVVSIGDVTDSVEGWLVYAGFANSKTTGGEPFSVGDANLDGFVDGIDFLVWNSSKFTANAAWCAGDFNADGIVDGLDFLDWNDNKFQAGQSIVQVPEPNTLVCALATFLLGLPRLLRQRRRGP